LLRLAKGWSPEATPGRAGGAQENIHFMQLHFSYDINKDVENIIKSTKAVNNKKLTKFQSLYIQKYSNDFDAANVKVFVEGQNNINNFDANKELFTIEERWKKVEILFTERVEKIFRIVYPVAIITVYLTHNERCTYNIDKNYFFVKIGSEFSNNTIMHELLHFYTWHAFGQKLVDGGLSKLAYNDVKESLTELLNLEFSDLMGGKPDKGYIQHESLRAEIRKLWLNDKKLAPIIDILADRLGK